VGVVEAVQVNDLVVSSSVIRDLITGGNVEDAAKLLGRMYTIEGEVIHGSHRGQTLGFPTANLKIVNELIPAHGVYAVLAEVENKTIKGVASIGIRPTFDAGPVSIEVYLFEFHKGLYGKEMEVSFVRHLRGEKKFPDAGALVEQIRKDVLDAQAALKNI
jgi:riboflavin kinase/FMN adenylyltransferase